MKLLLDENLPTDLRADFGASHEVYTVDYMKWKGIKNGSLLNLMAQHSFDALITVDKSMRFQLSTEKYQVVVIVLRAHKNTHKLLKPLVPKVLEFLSQNPTPGLSIIQ